MILILFLLLFATSAWAENIYVDASPGMNCVGNYHIGNRTCLEGGSDGDSYTTIQGAFNDSTLGSGDVIHIRSGTYSETADLGASGSSGSPIIIQSYGSETPTLRCTTTEDKGVITIANRSNVTIRNLRFIATGLSSPCLNAIRINATNTNIIGITITGNTFTNWGGNNVNHNPANTGYQTIRLAGTVTSGQPPTWAITAAITDNIFTGGIYTEIRVHGSRNVIIERNEISGTRCGHFQDNRTGYQAIKYSGESVATIIRGNYIHNLASNCSGVTLGSDETIFSAIYCDTGPKDTIIEKNLIHDISYPVLFNDPAGENLAAIFIESRCDRSITRYNVIYNMGDEGIRVGSPSNFNDDNQIIHNTIFNVKQNGVHINSGRRLIFKNNIVMTESGARTPIEIEDSFTATGPHHFDGNIYWQTGSTVVGRYGTDTTLTLTNWKSTLLGSLDFNSAADDDDSLNCNPSLSSTGTIQSTTSCAVDAGQVVSGYSKNGTLPTIGALDPPRFSSCVIESASPDRVDVLFTNNVKSPIIFFGVTGIAVAVDGTPRTVTGSLISGSNIIQYSLLTPVTSSSQKVTWSATALSTITDSSLIGNTLNQRYVDTAIKTCQNNTTGAPPASWVLTQSHFRLYRVPLLNGALDPLLQVNLRGGVIFNGYIIPTAQIKCTGAACPSTGPRAQGSWDGINWFNISDGTFLYVMNTAGGFLLNTDGGQVTQEGGILADNVGFAGLTELSGPEYPAQGHTIPGCLDATGLTATNQGIVQRTAQAVPTFTLGVNQCLTLGAMIKVDKPIIPGALASILRVRWVDQTGKPFTGTYVPAQIEVVDRQSGAGF